MLLVLNIRLEALLAGMSVSINVFSQSSVELTPLTFLASGLATVR